MGVCRRRYRSRGRCRSCCFHSRTQKTRGSRGGAYGPTGASPAGSGAAAALTTARPDQRGTGGCGHQLAPTPACSLCCLCLIGVGRRCFLRGVRLRGRSRSCRPRRARPTGLLRCPGGVCSFCQVCRSGLTGPARRIRCGPRPGGSLNAGHCRPRSGACRTGTTRWTGFALWRGQRFVLRRRGLFAQLACVRPMRRCGRPVSHAKKSPHLARHLPRETSRLFGRSQCRWRLGCVRRSAHGPPSPGPGFFRRAAPPRQARSSGFARRWSRHEQYWPSGQRLSGFARRWSHREQYWPRGQRLSRRGGRSRWHRPAPHRPGGPNPLGCAQPWSRRE